MMIIDFITCQDAVPVIKQGIICLQEETRKDRIYVWNCAVGPTAFFANHTAQFVISLIDGNKTIKDIYQAVSRKYQKLQNEKVEQDLNQLFNTFWQQGLIDIAQGGKKFAQNFTVTKKSAQTVKLVFDKDAVDAFGYLTTYVAKSDPEIFRYISPMNDLYLESVGSIRNTLQSMTHLYFLLELQNRIRGVCIMKLSTPKTPGQLEAMICPQKYIDFFWDSMIKIIKNVAPQEMTRVRSYVTRDRDVQKTLQGKLSFQAVSFSQQEAYPEIQALEKQLEG